MANFNKNETDFKCSDDHVDGTQSLPPEEVDGNVNDGNSLQSIGTAESNLSDCISLSTGSFVFVQSDASCSTEVDYVHNETFIETLRNTFASYMDSIPVWTSAVSSIVGLSYPTTDDHSDSLVSTDSVWAEPNEAANRSSDTQADQHIQTNEVDTACIVNSSNTPADSTNRVTEAVCGIHVPREPLQTFQFDTDKSDIRDEEWVQKRLKESKSIDDELGRRDCIKQALTENCKVVTGETIIGDDELDMLESKGCINSEDRFYMQANHIGPTQRTRRILSMLLLRDYKTLLTFLVCLKIQNMHVFDRILSCFNLYMRSGHRRKPECSRCLLETRVDMSLIVDDLLSSDNSWQSLYHRVSQSEYTEPRVLWDEFFRNLESGHMDDTVLPVIIKALVACGFHSDIIRKINEDQEMKRNSLVCNCNEMLSCENTAIDNPETEQQNTMLTCEIRHSPMSNSETQSGQTTTNSRHALPSDVTIAAEPVLDPEYYADYDTRIHTQVQTASAYNIGVNVSEDRKRVVNVTTAEHLYECAEHGVASPKPQHRNSEAQEDSFEGNSRNQLTNNSSRNPSEKSAGNDSEKSNSLKRKDITHDRNHRDKRQKNSIEDETNRTNDNRRRNTSSLELGDGEENDQSKSKGQNAGNCDLQIQLLKIGQPNYENEQDSVVSFESNSSSGSRDSGIGGEQSNQMLSKDEDETVPKQIYPDLKPSTSQSHPETQKVTNSGKTEEQHIDMHMPDETELDDSYLADADSVPRSEKEERVGTSDSHWDHDSERHDLEDMPTIVQGTPPPEQDELNNENIEIEPYIYILIKR